LEEDLEILKQALISADRDAAVGAAQRLTDAEVDPKVILEEGMSAAMFILGDLWKRGEVFLPEVVASAAIFKMCNAIVEPALLAQRVEGDEGDLVLLATVKGDLHDLGKNMVSAMMRTAGFEVTDLGKDNPPEKIIDAVRELHPQVIGLSALLTTTVGQQQQVIKALEKEGLRDKVFVLVGGAPVTQDWADEIKADGYAPSAPEAVNIAKKLTGKV